ncbi:MAG: hypothetical protein KDA99_22055, partial [Planctomycetales bacterium]|nr:hypothetical protein [Planctomycetales bacterium]
MAISVVDPISPALNRTKWILFQPFDLEKWLKLGFCAFLASLGDGGGTGGGGGGGGGGNGPGGNGGGPGFEPVWQWVRDHFTMILSIGAVVLVVGILLALLITWLSSRGKFMFIDGVVRNRGAVVQPWREFQAEGNSLFAFRFLFGLGCFVVFVMIAAISGGIAWPDIQAGKFGGPTWTAIAVGVLLVIPLAILAGLVKFCLTQFVVPIMYLRRTSAIDAWHVFRYELLPGRVGTLFLYLLAMIVMGFLIGMIA